MSRHSIPRDWVERCGRTSCRMAGWIHPLVSASILCGLGGEGAGEMGVHADSEHPSQGRVLSFSLFD